MARRGREREYDELMEDIERGDRNLFQIYGEACAEVIIGCRKYEAYIRKNPPHVTGHLLGGIDVERMLKIKAEIESRPFQRKEVAYGDQFAGGLQHDQIFEGANLLGTLH